MKIKENIPITPSEEESYKKHVEEKKLMREEKSKDKDSESDLCIVMFDLENVITLPKAEISSFFYKRKLNLYNLTAYTSKRGYCAIWTEATSGRAGNDIASAVVKVMESVIQDHPKASSVSLKYSITGHSAVQEVDNMHSQIERAMHVVEFYSPISFIRILLKAK